MLDDEDNLTEIFDANKQGKCPVYDLEYRV